MNTKSIKNRTMRMVQKGYHLAALLTFTMAFTACDDFLDKEFDATQKEDVIFGDETNTKGFLANIYTNLPDGLAPLSDSQFTGASRDCMTDNAISYWDLHYYSKAAFGAYTAFTHPLLGQWNVDLYGIRKCNQFLKNADIVVVGNDIRNDDDNQLYYRYLAEAKALRALFHFDLISWFGGIPLLGDNADGTPIVFDAASDMNVSRASAADALDWVISQCDDIIASKALPFRYANEAANWGRVNGAMVYALKCRAALYRASKLYNHSGSSVLESKNTKSDSELWNAAAEAAKDFITENAKSANPYKLYNTGKPQSDYYDSFVSTGVHPTQNPETILARSVWNTNVPENRFAPVGVNGGSFSGAGRTNPTQNFVDCFETAEGKQIGETGSGYDPQNPFANRDPRLSQIVFYHGMTWGVKADGEERQLDMSDEGVDKQSMLGGTVTGYYLKKFVNNISGKKGGDYAHVWAIFRYTEILLNAAEAYCEAGNTNEAEKYINEIRDRAGMPHYSGLSKEELLDRIRNERRIELSFEDHRLFDLRRWMSYEETSMAAEGVLSDDAVDHSRQLYHLYGVKISGEDVQAAPVFTYGLAEKYATRDYVAPRDRYYPIPGNEVKRCPNLKQNPGWEVGAATNDDTEE